MANYILQTSQHRIWLSASSIIKIAITGGISRSTWESDASNIFSLSKISMGLLPEVAFILIVIYTETREIARIN